MLEREVHLKQTEGTETAQWWRQEMNLTRPPTGCDSPVAPGAVCRNLGDVPVLPAEFSIMVRSEPRFMSSWRSRVQMEKMSILAFVEDQEGP